MLLRSLMIMSSLSWLSLGPIIMYIWYARLGISGSRNMRMPRYDVTWHGLTHGLTYQHSLGTVRAISAIAF